MTPGYDGLVFLAIVLALLIWRDVREVLGWAFGRRTSVTRSKGAENGGQP